MLTSGTMARIIPLVDDFEDNNYLINPRWHNYYGNYNNYTSSTDAEIAGTIGLKTTGVSSGYINTPIINYTKDGNLSAWVYQSGSQSGVYIQFGDLNNSDNSIVYDFYTGVLRKGICTDGTSTGITPSRNWHNVIFNIDGNIIKSWIYTDQGNLIYSSTDTVSCATGTTPRNIALIDSTGATAYYDNVVYGLTTTDDLNWDSPNIAHSGGGTATNLMMNQYLSQKTGLISSIKAYVNGSQTQMFRIWADNGSDANGAILGTTDTTTCGTGDCEYVFSTPVQLIAGIKYWVGCQGIGGGACGYNDEATFTGKTQQTGKFRVDTSAYTLYGDMNLYEGTPVFASFTSSVNKTNATIVLTDTSYESGTTITDWNWFIDSIKVSDDQNYTKTGAIQLTDYNVCLFISDGAENTDSECSTISTGDWTAPVTTFTATQNVGLVSSQIRFTCTDNNSGCKWTTYWTDANATRNITTNTGTKDVNILGVGTKTLYYYSTDNSDNNETTKSGTFTTYGAGRFTFKDENSGGNLTAVSVNFNGIDYNTGTANYLDINVADLTATNATYLFTFTKTDYATRYYQVDLNNLSDLNVVFAMIPETLSTEIIFKIFPPAGTSVLANTYIEFKDKDTNYTITRLKSDSVGELTAVLKTNDQNYYVWISEGLYVYQAVQLTVYYPKDEQTLDYITGNWRLEITDNISYQDLNILASTDKIIYLLPNTKYPFTIAVQDVAGTYFKRKWSKIYTGNPLTDTLQPYLLDADDGLAVKFVFQDPKRDSIENIVINIYKNIGGIKTLMSSSASDTTGNALFFLIAGDKYWIDFTYEGVMIFESDNYVVTSSVVYWTINLATQDIKTVDNTYITVVWNPATDFIPKDTVNIKYNVAARNLNRTRVEFYTGTGVDKNIIYTYDSACSSPCSVSIVRALIPITTGTLYADLNVYTDSNAYVFAYTKKWVVGTTSNIDTHDLFVRTRLDFGCTTDTSLPCPLTTILSVVIMIILVGALVFNFGFVNPKGLVVAGLGILAIFTYLGWFWWVAFILMVIGSIFYLRGEN